MKIISKILFLLLLMLFIHSCLDYRGRLIKKNAQLYTNGLISKNQYDSMLFKLYTLKDEKFIFNDTLIKTKGAYLCIEFSDYHNKNSFQIMKFDSIGNLFYSNRFYDSICNKNIQELIIMKTKYVFLNSNILVERIGIFNYKTYNIIEYAHLNGDTIEFYKKLCKQDSKYDGYLFPTKKYIYNDSLSAKFIY